MVVMFTLGFTLGALWIRFHIVLQQGMCYNDSVFLFCF